ncbi:MAG: hypothetical protein C0465_23870 [Ralstonia sp.]|nr:hypothetical protein [Ralstonia sp.]MBA4238614.1 hypothetical protein [Ralstonia sp.]POH85970.1 hypothetical protein CJ026_003010 [Ralstonia pickettii]
MGEFAFGRTSVACASFAVDGTVHLVLIVCFVDVISELSVTRERLSLRMEIPFDGAVVLG